jgi:hypothetical protein
MKIQDSLRLIPFLGLAGMAQAQISFSVDYLGSTVSLPSTCPGLPITAGDILTPATGAPCQPSSAVIGGLPPPSILIPGGLPAPMGLGIPSVAGCTGVPGGAPCPAELDALSYGRDTIQNSAGTGLQVANIFFSVDEFATGIAGGPFAPNVWSEGVLTGVKDHAADVFSNSLAIPFVPAGPGAPAAAGNKGRIDGDGLASVSGAIYAGLGLHEPRPPMVGPGPRIGDNIDGLDIGPVPVTTAGTTAPVFFSLDGNFADPARGINNLGTAQANGFLPGMVLTQVAGGPPAVYAWPQQLGLDLAGPGTDDLDALALQENAIPGFQPANTGVVPDLILFSVRRGSAVIGMPDSQFGMLICEGDILTVPAAGGVTPAIYVAAEWLGLVSNRGLAPAGLFGDELDALDVETSLPLVGQPYCSGDGSLPTPCPCGNFGNPGAGCNNSAGTGGAVLTATGSTVPDTVVLTSSGELPTSTSIFLQGTNLIANGVTFGDGVRCMGGPLRRLYVKNAVAGVVSAPVGAEPSITTRSAALGDILLPGTTRYYQVQYRDPANFCTAALFNASSGYVITW